MLHIRLFGSPRIVRDDRPVAFDTRKATALLAVLAVTGFEHGREALAGLFWPELDHARARAALRRTLSVAGGPELIVGPSGIGLDLLALRCDVREFRALAAAADPRDWARAANLAADDFLAGFGLRDSAAFEDWQFATADQLRTELSQLLGRLVARSVADGDLSAALTSARRRLQVDRLSEPAHADLIRVLALTGDRPGAIAAYRSLVRTLDGELGVPPLPDTIALHDAVRAGMLLPIPATIRPLPQTDRSASVLAGRQAEIGRLDALWQAALRGGAVAGLVGDPGIGKTALARHFADRCAADGRTTLLLTGHSAERAYAFGGAAVLVRGLLEARPSIPAELGADGLPLAALSDRIAGDRGRPLRTGADLERLHEAFRDAVEIVAEDTGLVLVVDDAHLIDTRSAALLTYLVRRPVRGLLVLATWPTGSGDAQLPGVIVGAGRSITVMPLDLAGVTELLAGAADPDEVLRRTHGVPLLVQELATGSAGPDAATARELVVARLEAAPELTRQLVGAAAVLGVVADPELLRVACGRDEGEAVDAIEDALARGLLVEDVDRHGYDVPHDLVRDAALARLSLARVRLLHARIAEVLARRHGLEPTSTPAGAVARHYAGAGRDSEAAAWFATAAAESARLAAYDEALDELRLAHALGHPSLEVHEATGAALVRLGRYRDALVALDQAAALADDQPARQAAIEHAIAGVHDRLGAWMLAHAHLEAARDLLAAGPTARRARIVADLALVEHRLGRASAASATAAQAVAEALAVGDRAALAQATNVQGVLAHARGDHAEARELLQRAVELAVDDPPLAIAALNNLSHALLGTGDAIGAMTVARTALSLAEQQGDRHRIAALHSHLADLLHGAGDEKGSFEALRAAAVAFGGLQGATVRPEVWTLTEW